MGSAFTPNVERQGNGGVLIEAEDDDPGIRGLSSYSSSPNYNHKHPLVSQFESKPSSDILDAAIIDQARVRSGSAALKLDQFVLGKTELASDIAQGSLSTSRGSALSSLKGVASSLHDLHSASLPIPTPPKEVAASPGTLTWSSNSPASSSSLSSSSSSNASSAAESKYEDAKYGTPKYDYFGHKARSHDGKFGSRSPDASSPSGSTDSGKYEGPSYLGDEVYHMPIKRMIKQVCVAGLQPRTKANRHFCLSPDEIRDICRLAQGVFLEEPSFLRLDAPIKIIGDIHGQFRDLMRFFKKGGMPPSQHYLFLGDYVDRGKHSLETIMLLLLLKLRYPSHVHLLRGNHECAGVTKVYGFYDECKRRSTLKSWRHIVDVFNTLPVAALVGGRIFCVHGGISPSLTSFSRLEAIQRPTDIPDAGILSDILWSDPDPQVKEWSENDRGVSFCFGPRSLERFCKQQNVDLVVRGHMVVEDGYEFFAGRRLVTVFSAPNYCGDFDNYGAMMTVGSNLVCSFDTVEPKSKVVKDSAAAHASHSNQRSSSSSPLASPPLPKQKDASPTCRDMSKHHQSSDVVSA